VYGQDGKKYLDFSCGIAVTNTGHCHPKVVKAAQQQLGMQPPTPWCGCVDLSNLSLRREIDSWASEYRVPSADASAG
jgi:hypothetical protein